MYSNWPSTAPKAGHRTDLRLTLCAPLRILCSPMGVRYIIRETLLVLLPHHLGLSIDVSQRCDAMLCPKCGL